MLSDWQPDWVSLQFVCYGFNRKGLPFKELFWLPPLLRGRSLHVMLHELWVDSGHFTTIKNTIVGVAQRWLVVRLLRRLQPTVVQTTNPHDRQVLTTGGIKASVVPLFSNIPVTTDLAGEWLAIAIRENRGPDIQQDCHGFWLFGLFGSIGQGWPADELLPRLAAISREMDRRMVVISAGRAGPHATALLEEWRRQYRDIDFVAVGPRSDVEISQFLNSMDFGLTQAPVHRLAKSGSVAAMVEHGLPVIVSWKGIPSDVLTASTPFGALIWQNDACLATHLRSPPARVHHPDWCAVVARSLLSRLQETAGE